MTPNTPLTLSHYQTTPMLAAIDAGETAVATSLDLGLTTAVVPLTASGVQLTPDVFVNRATLTDISSNELGCYRLLDGDWQKIQFFSDTLNRHYSLMPTASAPTMLVSGTPMHRIKDTNPHQDTQAKIKAVAPAVGAVLDTTMGLGYTAVLAAQTASHVTTIELDPTVVEVCRANPWSQGLFTLPNIERRIGDAFDVVETLPDEEFSRIVHDPPMFKLAGHLYSTDFYRELYRVLKAKGRLFHYIGDPSSKSGKSVTKGAMRRLQDAGFRRLKPWPQAFGVIAYK